MDHFVLFQVSLDRFQRRQFGGPVGEQVEFDATHALGRLRGAEAQLGHRRILGVRRQREDRDRGVDCRELKALWRGFGLGFRRS